MLVTLSAHKQVKQVMKAKGKQNIKSKQMLPVYHSLILSGMKYLIISIFSEGYIQERMEHKSPSNYYT